MTRNSTTVELLPGLLLHLSHLQTCRDTMRVLKQMYAPLWSDASSIKDDCGKYGTTFHEQLQYFSLTLSPSHRHSWLFTVVPFPTKFIRFVCFLYVLLPMNFSEVAPSFTICIYNDCYSRPWQGLLGSVQYTQALLLLCLSAWNNGSNQQDWPWKPAFSLPAQLQGCCLVWLLNSYFQVLIPAGPLCLPFVFVPELIRKKTENLCSTL